MYENQYITTTVNNKDGLNNAVKSKRYSEIVITGNYAQEVAAKLITRRTVNCVSEVATAIGFFISLPLTIAGIAGIASTNEISKWEIVEVDEDKAIVRLSDKYMKKFNKNH